MRAPLAFVSLCLAFATTVAKGETLVTCTVFDGDATTTTVAVQKLAAALPSGQQHFTSLVTIGGMQYVVAETFDGSGKVGIGRAKVVEESSSLEFDLWAYAKPPIDLFTTVFVSCK